MKKFKFSKIISQEILPSLNNQKLFNNLLKFSLLLSIFYLSIRSFDNIYYAQAYLGDEAFYTDDIHYYNTHGYKKSLIHGISFSTTLFSYLF